MSTRALRPAPLVVAVVAVLGFSALTVWLVALVEGRHEAVVEAQVAQSASTVFTVLDSELTSTLNLAQGLAGLVAYDPALDGIDDGEPVGDALEAVHARSDHLRNIGLAPGNVLEHVYPLAGNESAIGLRYEEVPAQWADVNRAMQSGETVLAGPVDLVQGGRGLINRTPVFLGDDSYWGVISLVVDVDSMIGAVESAVGDLPIEWAVRTRAAAGRPAIVVTGDPALFAGDVDVRLLDVPGGTWELAAEPARDGLADAPPLGVLRSVGFGTALLIGLLAAAVTAQHEGFRELSLHDALTGLPNRRLLQDRLEQALRASASRDDGGCAVLAVDLDGFKTLNDTLGHAAGDAALRDVADSLRALVRAGDTVARVGGDEFVVVLPGTELTMATTVVAPRVLDELTWTVEHGGHEVPLGVTIGVAHAPTHASDAGLLLRAADAALYRGKRAGRGLVVPADEIGAGHPGAEVADGREEDRVAVGDGGPPSAVTGASR